MQAVGLFVNNGEQAEVCKNIRYGMMQIPQKLNGMCPKRRKRTQRQLCFLAAEQSVAVENSYRYAMALYRKSCELHVFPYGVHGRALSLDDPHVAQWKELQLNWFRLYKWI